MLILQLENTQEFLSSLINIISFSINKNSLLAQARSYLINIAHEETPCDLIWRPEKYFIRQSALQISSVRPKFGRR